METKEQKLADDLKNACLMVNGIIEELRKLNCNIDIKVTKVQQIGNGIEACIVIPEVSKRLI